MSITHIWIPYVSYRKDLSTFSCVLWNQPFTLHFNSRWRPISRNYDN